LRIVISREVFCWVYCNCDNVKRVVSGFGVFD
jgi:hypothetical protein